MHRLNTHRQNWVDISKGIGIVLVVYGHVARGVFNAGIAVDEHIYSLVDSVIYSFHMPLFFVVSGLFFTSSIKRRGEFNFALNKIDTIIYPYILWSLLQGGVEVFLSKYTNGSTNLADVLSLLWAPRAQFWFLYALFVVTAICIPIYKNASAPRMLILCAAFSIAYIFKSKLAFDQISGFFLSNACFFSVGILIGRYGIPQKVGTPLSVLGMAILFCLSQIAFHNTQKLSAVNLGLWSYLNALVSVFFVFSFSLFLSKFQLPLLTYIGSASMSIFLAHVLAASGARILLKSALHIYSAPIHLILGTILGVIIPLFIHSMAKKFGFVWLFEAPPYLSATRLLPKHQ